MKLAIVTPVYPPYRGGMGAVAEADAKRLQERGLTVQVFTPDYGRERSPEVCVEYVQPVFTQGNAALLPKLYKKLWGIDLVHLHHPFYGADLFVLLSHLIRRTPYVVTYHMRASSKDYRQVFFSLHRWLFEPWLLYFAKAVIVSSLDYAQAIGLKHRHLVEIPFGVNTQLFSPGSGTEFRTKHHIPLTSSVALFVGGLDRAHFFKGLDVLLTAGSRLSRATDWRLLIVGEGDLRAEYEAKAHSLGIADRVIFTGALSDQELPQAFRAADVHVLPSIAGNEAFGLVTLEAAATGIPSIVSDLPGVRTVVEPGKTGYVVPASEVEPLANRLTELFHNKELRQGLGKNARERALTHYAEGRLAEQLLFVYNT